MRARHGVDFGNGKATRVNGERRSLQSAGRMVARTIGSRGPNRESPPAGPLDPLHVRSPMSPPSRRPLGTTGLTISPIGLGCMGMSEFYGKADDAQSTALIHHTLDAGV